MTLLSSSEELAFWRIFYVLIIGFVVLVLLFLARLFTDEVVFLFHPGFLETVLLAAVAVDVVVITLDVAYEIIVGF